MKRFISILLATLLVVSSMSLVVSADTGYYRYKFDSGIFGNPGGNSIGADTGNATTSVTATMTPGDSIMAKGWVLTATGMKSLQYKIDDGEWTDVALELDNVVASVYANELNNNNASAEANANCRFNFSVPTTFADGETHTFTLRFITNEVTEEKEITNGDGTTTTETTVVAASETVEFATADISVASKSIPVAPVYPSEYGKLQISRDRIDVLTLGNMSVFGGNASNVTTTAVHTTSITFRGWLSVADAFATENAFGYSIDGGDIVYGEFATDFDNDEDAAAIKNAATYKDYYTRYAISVPVSDLSVGTHTVKTYLRLDIGWTLILNETSVDVSADLESTAEETAWDIILDSGEYNVADLMQSGNRFRNQWSPRGGNHPIFESFINLMTSDDGDNYAKIGGFTEAYSDNTWVGPYGASIDMKIDTASSDARGFYFDFCNVERQSYEVRRNAAEELVISPNGGIVVTNTSGACLVPVAQNKLVIYVLCYDETNGYSAIDYVVETAADLYEFNKYTVIDNGVNTVQIFVGTEKVASITYADAETVDTGVCAADFNRTVAILNAAGETVASTDIGLMAVMHRASIATRANEFCFDNIDITKTSAVSTVKVECVDGEGNVIGEAEELYFEGYSYSIATPAIEGYAAEAAVVTGTVGADDTVHTVKYTALAKYDLTINYVDADGNALAEAVVLSLTEGQTYSVDSPAIDGYTADTATVAGTMGTEAIVINVVYTANVVETPTITLAEGSDYVLNSTKGIVVIPSATKATTYANFIANFATPVGGSLVVKTAAGAVTTNARAIATGFSIELQVDGAVIETYNVAMVGDVSGDGRVTSNDASSLASAIAAKTTGSWSVAMKHAANAYSQDSRGTIANSDVISIETFVSTGVFS